MAQSLAHNPSFQNQTESLDDQIGKEINFPKERSGLAFLLKLRSEKLNFFVKLMQKEGSYVGYKIFNDPILFLTDATAIQHIFQTKNSDYKRSKYIKNLKYIFSGGIFLSDGENWKRQRSEAAPAFANGKFPEMTQQMVSTMLACMRRFDKASTQGTPIDINLEMTRYALDVAIGSLFHLSRDEGVERMMDSLGTLLRESEQRIWALFMLPQSLTMMLPKYRRALNNLRSAVDDLISERQKNPTHIDDLLSRAIGAYERGETTYSVLQDKIVAYLTSAHETTANSLVWALFEISQRPEIIQAIRDEVELLPNDSSFSYEDVKKLTYTKQVFEEALRLYPSVWTMSREASQDDYLPLDDGTKVFVKKGTTLMLSPYAVHRRKEYWPNPLAFDPGRFTLEETNKRPKMAYIPFSGGARLCLGFRFAQIEAVIALAFIVRNYDISLIPGQDIQPQPNITLRPNKEVFFNFQPRRIKRAIEENSSKAVHHSDQACPFHSSITHSNHHNHTA